MHVGALQALEFDRIVEALASFAATPLGAARLAALRPQTDPRRVAALLAATSEAVKYGDTEGRLALRSPADVDAILSALAIEGRPLEPLRLLGLADFLESIDAARAAIRRSASAYPSLRTIVDAAASFKAEVAEVRAKIDSSGAVVDNASAELRSVRDRLRRQRSRLQGVLESFLRGKDTSRYLQEQIVTDRNGRYVLMVKAEHRSAIPGIIHGSSASGATLFLEPLSTVELNNEIVALEEQEAEEVRRILLALTNGFRGRPADVQRTVEAAVELDVVQAKADFARLVGGSEPAISPDGTLDLRSARHPLLIAAVNARLDDRHRDNGRGADDVDGSVDEGARGARSANGTAMVNGSGAERLEPVPVDIRVAPPTSVLVITGPNTGGKTVALKTAGLLPLMAQAGLHIPAAPGSRLPVFRSVFADIGDEQSIAASLSTFSWHITNIASMDRRLSLPALVLLDEIGVGTDPVEGGALGMAVIDHFRRRGALVIATTHYEALKSYASTTAGVEAAGFGFNPDTFEPTYRLLYGAPGRSLALEISGRLGLNPSILAAARGNVTDREAQLAAHLQKIDEDLRALEHERRLVAREREAIRDTEERLRNREASVREREEAARRRFDKQVDDRLRDARQEIDAVVADLKRKAADLAERAAKPRLVPTPLSTGDTGALRVDALHALEQAAGKLRGEPSAEVAHTGSPAGGGQTEAARPAKVGDRVVVHSLGLDGLVVGISGTDADVDVRGKRLRVPAGGLRVLAQAGASAARVNVHVTAPSQDESSADLNIIGFTVDEAVTRLEKFLDDMLLGDLRSVRIVHGYGTGQLRRAVAQFLQRHPLVANFSPAPPEHGGGGVTVVELKD